MDLAVMALRLALKEALCPQASRLSGEWPTLARDRVFDSRFDAVDGRAGERTPMIIFGAEEHGGEAFSSQNGALAGELGVDSLTRMVFSIQITSRRTRQLVLEEGGEPEPVDIEEMDLLDHELADMLAIVAAQIELVLADHFIVRKLIRRATKLDATPFPDSESGEKIAVLACNWWIAPLTDGRHAMEVALAHLPAGPERDRATAALGHLAATEAFIAAQRLARSSLAAPAPFSVTGTAQGFPATPPAPPSPSTPDVALTLDPPEPLAP